MSLIEWNDLYSVNIEEMDQQHKQLLNIVNEFDKAVEAKKEEETTKNKYLKTCTIPRTCTLKKKKN